jgi:ketosteroid isomerase-like protein
VSEPDAAVDVVERAFRALAANDLEAAKPFFAEDMAYHLLNYQESHQRLFRGRDAFLELRAQVGNVTNGTYTFDMLGLYPAGSELVILHAATRATFDGRSGGGHWVAVSRVVDGVIVQVTDTAETALDLFWRPADRYRT